MSQAIRSHDMLFEKFEKFYYDGIQCLNQSNFSQFTKKIPFQARVIEPIRAKIIQPDSLSGSFKKYVSRAGGSP